MHLMIQFDISLYFFLARANRDGTIRYASDRRASVKDIIESFGVPHTEVGQILHNDNPADFSHIPEKGGRLVVSGISPPFDICTPSFLRRSVFDQVRFVADVNVMKLGKMMVLLGFDVVCPADADDGMIADLACEQRRIVLTRDTRLLMRNKIVFARRIREHLPLQQLLEVISFFGLEKKCRFLSRCTHCNSALSPVEKSRVIHLLEPKTRLYYHTFFQCPDCRKVYWRGSHYQHLAGTFKKLGIAINS
jgi:uncharacterized protein with PIN domain